MAFAWIAVGNDRALATAALEAGFTTLVGAEAPGDGSAGLDGIESLARMTLVRIRGDDIILNGERVGTRVQIRNVADQTRALERAGKDKLLVVDAADWKVIPIENLIAACQGKTSLVAETGRIEEAKLFLETLEVGVDGILYHPHSASDVHDFAKLISAAAEPKVALGVARIRSIRAIGTGDRVCLDTASLLAVGEGVLVGSHAHALFLVASESQESGYVAARPFRVNAGAVHAYVLLPNGRTKYLSELRAGDEILAVRPDGDARAVLVGRVKIERRPLLLVEAEAAQGNEHRSFSTLLQNAETVPLAGPKGPVPVTKAKPGDEVLVRLEAEGRGRHFGTAIRETITER